MPTRNTIAIEDPPTVLGYHPPGYVVLNKNLIILTFIFSYRLI